jgi:hypothetical protein
MVQAKLSSRKTRAQRNEDINISALSGMVPTNDNTWLIDSGASKHRPVLEITLHISLRKRHIYMSFLEMMPDIM